MANVRTITSEDIEKYGLKGKQVGDVISAQEDYEMRKKAGENVDVIDPATGLTDLPTSIESDGGVVKADSDKASKK